MVERHIVAGVGGLCVRARTSHAVLTKVRTRDCARARAGLVTDQKVRRPLQARTVPLFTCCVSRWVVSQALLEGDLSRGCNCWAVRSYPFPYKASPRSRSRLRKTRMTRANHFHLVRVRGTRRVAWRGVASHDRNRRFKNVMMTLAQRCALPLWQGMGL